MFLALLLLYISLCSSCLAKSISSVGDGPLNLTPYIEEGDASQARDLSAVDPTLFAGVHSHAAYIQVNKTNKWNTFFWLFPAEGLPLESTPWIIWLQGGPGASSLYGLFNEIGPLQLENNTAVKMPVTWGSNYSLLFIDNPVGAGFSYSETDRFMSNQDDVGAELLSFIQQFLEVFPELRKAPLFIAGESYAGKYIPAFGHYIHHNKNDSRPINLRGLAIGDGWTDPPSLLHSSELLLQLGIIDPKKANATKLLEDKARQYWKEGKIAEYAQTYKLIHKIPLYCNEYNFLKDDATPISLTTMKFLNQTQVKSALRVGNRSYVELNKNVQNHFRNDFFLSVKPWLEELLDHYGVLCYNGQLDIIVGYALSVHTYHSLQWSGREAYLNAERVPLHSWNSKKTLDPIGFLKASGNFMDVMIRAAGHMVPGDQPVAAKQMIDMFITKFQK